jgi:hypothetical protein
MLAALAALVAGPRRTLSFLGQLVIALTIVLLLLALVIVGLALFGG